ncbi:Nitrogen regulatory protein P-II [Sporomusa carbonis]|uniref:P-II family nitrogen regulator n=1 Tax=Sporomusa carbonis TaxID=3076075 RepID=UPI003A62DC55
MKEVVAIIRMNKVNATKKALVEVGYPAFTTFKVMGRGKLVTDPVVIEDRKRKLLAMSDPDDPEVIELVTGFLDGTRLFPRRLFTVLVHDADVPLVVDALIKANKTEYNVGDGKIFVLPMLEAVRVRTGERGEAAL